MDDNGQAKKLPQYIAALSVCLGSVAAGTVLGWTSNISEDLKASKLNDIFIDDDSLGWIGSFATIGAMVMCFPIGTICEYIGRKWGCLITVCPFTVGWLLIICASNTGMIYAGRFLTGLAGGAFCVAAPIYTSEIAQNEIRGTLGSFFQLLLTVGILISYPETPVYYTKKHKTSEALSSLQRLRGQSYNCDGEIKEIQIALEQDASIQVSFWREVQTTASMRAIFICFSLMFFQQMSGVNAVIFYTGDIFESAGSTLASSTATIIVGVMQVIATFVSSVVVDRFGRKLLLLSSIIFMMLSGLVLGIFFTLKDRNVIDTDAVNSIGFLPILCLIVFISAFSLGFGPIPWLISAELMPQEIKSIACSAAATFNWILAFIVTRFYATLKNAIGGDSTFYIFAGISMFGIAFVFLAVPETKGKSFVEVQDMLSGKVKAQKGQRDGIDNPTFKE
ncbi:hypothetical protein NQ317_002576 [Molorchus minor]|uniref:Major facilitator superfamily (MFS) profile domain-containing protein n=1 Tax=Molorchus minor TaxID=1323400 RepID=A0ABQ9JVF9_9CUCU|nr:hypothetical protein NQ317_002576 [Molorchus minor]